ncbi:hypothetical protein D3C86_1362830 [compost metagenome]
MISANGFIRITPIGLPAVSGWLTSPCRRRPRRVVRLLSDSWLTAVPPCSTWRSAQ